MSVLSVTRGVTAVLTMLSAFSALAENAPVITEFPLDPSLIANGATPQFIAAGSGPNADLWFSDFNGAIGRVTIAGAITEFSAGLNSGSAPSGIALGADGNLWFTDEGSTRTIGQITPSGSIREFAPSGIFLTIGIAAGPDGNLWFTDQKPAIGQITTGATPAITEFTAGFGAGRFPIRIAAGPPGDGGLWFTEGGTTPAIGRIDATTHAITEFSTGLNASSAPAIIVAGPDGNLWFTDDGNTPAIGRITPAGVITEFSQGLPALHHPFGIVAAPDGNLWFTDNNATAPAIGRVTTAGGITEFSAGLHSDSEPINITLGPDGNLWFVDNGLTTPSIGRLTLPSLSDITLFSAVLPASRSVELGASATVFGTMINSSTDTAGSACQVQPATSIPASFFFQTTDPSTNALTGTPNTPVSLAPGASQSFVLGLTPSAVIAPTEISFNFSCANAPPAVSNIGLNTLLFSASTTPTPDIVALAATANNDGIVDIPGATGTGAFAVATVNLGVSSAITASANTGAANLPVTITLCQTVPATGQCMAAPTASVTTMIANNAEPTFAIFVQGNGNVPFLPDTNRVFVQFQDSGNAIRGLTSVAVRTQ
jgi:streptogramin lyase